MRLKQKLEEATCQRQAGRNGALSSSRLNSSSSKDSSCSVSFFSHHPNKSLALIPLLDCALPPGKILKLQYTCDYMKSPGRASKYVELVIPFFKYERCRSSFQNYLLI